MRKVGIVLAVIICIIFAVSVARIYILEGYDDGSKKDIKPKIVTQISTEATEEMEESEYMREYLIDFGYPNAESLDEDQILTAYNRIEYGFLEYDTDIEEMRWIIGQNNPSMTSEELEAMTKYEVFMEYGKIPDATEQQ
jgi:hypothetical protein